MLASRFACWRRAKMDQGSDRDDDQQLIDAFHMGRTSPNRVGGESKDGIKPVIWSIRRRRQQPSHDVVKRPLPEVPGHCVSDLAPLLATVSPTRLRYEHSSPSRRPHRMPIIFSVHRIHRAQEVAWLQMRRPRHQSGS